MTFSSAFDLLTGADEDKKTWGIRRGKVDTDQKTCQHPKDKLVDHSRCGGFMLCFNCLKEIFE